METILFLCTGNSCRSQMAEGLTRFYKGDTLKAYSAGVEVHGLNPIAVEVMAEIGIDISLNKSQHIEDFKEMSLDYVVTVCSHAHENCPVFPGQANVTHVGFDDPPKMAKEIAKKGGDKQSQMVCYRLVRDQIKDFILSLPESLKSCDS